MNVWFGYSLSPDLQKRHPIEIRAFAHESDAAAWRQEWEWLREAGILREGAQRIVQELHVEGTDLPR